MKLLGHLLAVVVLLVLVFWVTWLGVVFLLWEGIYGDRYGGRWTHLAWLPACLAAGTAVSLYWARFPLGHRLSPKVYQYALVLWIVVSAISIAVGGRIWFSSS